MKNFVKRKQMFLDLFYNDNDDDDGGGDGRWLWMISCWWWGSYWFQEWCFSFRKKWRVLFRGTRGEIVHWGDVIKIKRPQWRTICSLCARLRNIMLNLGNISNWSIDLCWWYINVLQMLIIWKWNDENNSSVDWNIII